MSSFQTVFTTINSYPPNLPAAWFVFATVGDVKVATTNISDDTESGNNLGGVGFQAELSMRCPRRSNNNRYCSCMQQQQPDYFPAIPTRLQHHPLPYGLNQKPTAPQEVMKDTSESMDVDHCGLCSSHQARCAQGHQKIIPWSS